MTTLKIAAYGQGVLYPPGLMNNLSSLTSAGWTNLTLSLFHIHADGSLFFNDTAIVVCGKYVADYQWASNLKKLVQPSKGQAIQLSASFGGWAVGDFGNIKTIYEENHSSFTGTDLEANFKVLYNSLGESVSIIDMDVEKDYDQTSFVAFCQMLIGIGFKITFCPYAMSEIDFWTGSLKALNTSNPGSVLWWNLQCYSGGSGNEPSQWAEAIEQAIPGFDTDGYILVSDSAGANDDPSAVQSMLAAFKGTNCVGGAFLWTLDGIYNDTSGQLTIKYAPSLYVGSIETALEGSSN